MVRQDKYLQEVFEEPPLVAHKRQKNLKDLLIRAKVAKKTNNMYNTRVINGMKKCGKCISCNYIKEGKEITNKQETWKITKQINCKTTNVIYMLECKKCNARYIGETEREFRERIKEHIGYARTKNLNKVTGNHFNLPGHEIYHMKFTVIEKVKFNNTQYRKEREKFHINKFDTYRHGMNERP